MRSTPRCRRCGDPIAFMPYQAGPGVVKYLPINLDDKRPHWKRCALTVASKEERRRPVKKSHHGQISLLGTWGG